MKQFEILLCTLNFILICIVIYLVFIRGLKENYKWTMDDTIGNIFANGSCDGTESSKHAFQTKTGDSDSDYTLYMGSDKNKGNSYIQSVNISKSTAPLFLNYRGGLVGTGGDMNINGGLRLLDAPISGKSYDIPSMYNLRFSRSYTTTANENNFFRFKPTNNSWGNIQVTIKLSGWLNGLDWFSMIVVTNIWNDGMSASGVGIRYDDNTSRKPVVINAQIFNNQTNIPTIFHWIWEESSSSKWCNVSIRSPSNGIGMFFTADFEILVGGNATWQMYIF